MRVLRLNRCEMLFQSHLKDCATDHETHAPSRMGLHTFLQNSANLHLVSLHATESASKMQKVLATSSVMITFRQALSITSLANFARYLFRSSTLTQWSQIGRWHPTGPSEQSFACFAQESLSKKSQRSIYGVCGEKTYHHTGSEGKFLQGIRLRDEDNGYTPYRIYHYCC
jgi:DNA-binding transcriptional regulator YiaG